ncbi:MAG: hypothetical protein JNM68_08080, partial [Dinghuibacter sp.]|nr:hypothetical protein [Dinghuibacter sp.]
MSQKRIEDIFKDALEHDQAPAHDGDWAQMAKMLDGPPTGKNEPERRRRKWLFWWWLPFIFTGVALFTVFYKPNEKNTGNPVAKQEQPATNTKNPQQPETASNNTNTATGKNNDTQMVPPHTGIIKEQNTVQPVQPSGPLQPNSGAISPENNRGSIGRAEQENNDSPVNARKQGTAGITGIPDLGNKKANTTNNRFPRRNKTIKEQQAAPANDEPVNRYYGKQKRVRPSARYAKSKINGETVRNKKNRFNENSAAELYDEVESEAPAIESKLNTVGQLKKMNLAMPELPGLTTPYLVAGKALPDTFIRNEKVSRYKQKPFRERSKNMLGLPQWVSVGYDVLPLASSRYNMRYFSTPFTPYQEPEFYLDSMNPRKVSRGGHIAIGGEWFPRNDQWSLNSYLALQYSEASQLSRSSKINYGVGYAQVDTV